MTIPSREKLLAAELARYVLDHGVEHLPKCPQDDNCRCPHVAHINELLTEEPPLAVSQRCETCGTLPPDMVSVAWVLSQLSGMVFPQQGQAYDFIKRALQGGR